MGEVRTRSGRLHVEPSGEFLRERTLHRAEPSCGRGARLWTELEVPSVDLLRVQPCSPDYSHQNALRG